MDKYQERYMAHQTRKRASLLELMKLRHSDRMFSDKPLDDSVIKSLGEVANLCPSSCDRRAISLNYINDRSQKEFLGGVLVGGVGWIHRASHIILLWADQDAYKERLEYMPYLDAGVIVQQLYLTCTDLGISCCFVNPNIRDKVKPYFYEYFHAPENLTFVGAMALGNKFEG